MRISPGRILEVEGWLVPLAAIAGMASLRLLPAAPMLALAFGILRWLTRGRITRRTPADVAVALLALTLAVTWWVSPLPAETRLQVLRVLTGIALYYTLANWAESRQRLDLASHGLVAAGLALALSAPFSVAWPAGKLFFIPADLYQRFHLLAGDTIHPNVLAGSLVIILPLALARLLFDWRSLAVAPRALYLLASAGMLLVLALTQSRGAWLALAVAAVILAAVRLGRWGMLAVSAVTIAGAAAAWLLGPVRMLEGLLITGTSSSIDGRIAIWERGLAMAHDFAFTGIGMGAFGQVADAAYPFYPPPAESIPHAHNLFLQVAVDLGVPGLVAWLAIFLLACAAATGVYRQGRRSGSSWYASLGAGLLCSQIALATHGLTDAVTWGMVRPAPLVWAVWGLAAAGSLFSRAPESV